MEEKKPANNIIKLKDSTIITRSSGKNYRTATKESIKTDPWINDSLLYSSNPDKLLVDKGKNLSLYKRMKMESTVNSGLQIRKDLALSTDYNITIEGDDTPKAKIQRDFVDEVLKNLKTIAFRDLMECLLDGEWLGYIIAEPKWESYGKYWIYEDIKIKDSENFNFKVDPYGNLEKLIYGIDTEIDPSKVILGTFPYVKNGNFYGTSCLQSVYVDWWSKSNILKFRNMYLQNRGSAPLMGVYQEGDENARAIAENLLNSLQEDFWTTVPGFMNENSELIPHIAVKAMEVATSAGTSEFEEAIAQLDKSITRGLLLPDNLGFTDTTAGSYAQTRIQYKTVIYGLKKRLYRLEDIVNKQIIRPLLEANFEVPEKVVLRFEEPDDEFSEMKSNVLATLIDKGIVDPKETFVRAYMGIPEEIEYIEGEAPEDREPEPMPPIQEPIEEPLEDDTVKKLKAAKFKEVLSRKKYQKTINFKKLEDNFDSLEEKMLIDLSPVFDSMQKNIVKQVERKILATNDLNKINTLAFGTSIGKIRDIILRGMFSSYMQGKVDLSEEIKDYSGRNVIDVKMKAPDEIFLQDVVLDIYTSEELKNLGFKGLNDWLLKYGTKLTAQDKANLKQMVSKASSIAGDDINEQLLINIKKVVRTGIGVKPTSQIISEVNKAVSMFVNEALIDPAVPLVSVQGAIKLNEPIGRLRTIVRNATSTQYNQGSVAQALDPSLQGFVEAAQYTAILDSNTTAFCEAHDGEVVDVGSSDFIALTAPNHHGCRTVWVYFFKGEEYDKNWMDKSDTQLKKIYKSDNIKSIRSNYTNGVVGFGKA